MWHNCHNVFTCDNPVEICCDNPNQMLNLKSGNTAGDTTRPNQRRET